MNVEISGLFNEICKVAHLRGAYSDSELEDMAGMLNPGAHRTFYLGSNKCMDNQLDYFLVEWRGEAAVGFKATVPGRDKSYTFFDFTIEDNGLVGELKGLYSTLLSKKEDRFDNRMGSIGMSGNLSANADFIVTGMLRDALKADVKCSDN